MFHDFTIVHLSLVGAFAALGLKGLVVYRNKRVSVDIAAGERQLLQFTYSDVTLLFAVLAVITVDRTSLEFFVWVIEQLKSGPKVASVLVFGSYVTALSCAFGYAFGNAIVLFISLTLRMLKRAVTPSK